MCIFNDFDNKDNKFRLNRIVFPLREKLYLTFFSQFRSVLYYVRQDMGATAPKNAVLSVARCNALQWTMQCIAFVIAPHCIKKAIPFRKKSGMAERVKECSKNSEFRFLPFLVSSVSAAFRPFRCHFVKSHQSHSPLCSFFNFQKYTQKKNENQRDIIYRTSLISSVL
jgi:hypothetical protein